MHARAVDEAAAQLLELRADEREGFILGIVVLASAVVATTVAPSFAIPLFVGGLFSLTRAVRAAFRRCELLDTLASDRDAYEIAEVAERARRAATMTSRRSLAASIHGIVGNPAYALSERIVACGEELEALAADLERDDLELDPVQAVDCHQLLTDGRSPLFNSELGNADLLYRLRHIRAGFVLPPTRSVTQSEPRAPLELASGRS
jgi:hypothetical protein